MEQVPNSVWAEKDLRITRLSLISTFAPLYKDKDVFGEWKTEDTVKLKNLVEEMGTFFYGEAPKPKIEVEHKLEKMISQGDVKPKQTKISITDKYKDSGKIELIQGEPAVIDDTPAPFN